MVSAGRKFLRQPENEEVNNLYEEAGVSNENLAAAPLKGSFFELREFSRHSTAIFATSTAPGSEHLLVLSFFHSLKRQALDGFLFIWTLTQRDLVPVDGNRLTWITARSSIGFLVFGGCRGQNRSHQLSFG